MQKPVWAGFLQDSAVRKADGVAAAAAPYFWAALLLGASIVLQKIALPGSGRQLPLSSLVMALVLGVGVVKRTLVVDSAVYFAFVLMLVVAACSYLRSESNHSSFLSLAYFCACQVAFVFRWRGDVSRRVSGRLLLLFRNLVIAVAVAGLLQFAVQFVWGPGVAFFLDFRIPEGLLLQHFNLLNPLRWGSSIFKSNGVVLLEPSFFCQLLSIGVAIELLTFRSMLRLMVLCCAVIISFSGTGLLMLALFVPWYALTQKSFGTLAVAGAAAVLLWAGAAPLHIVALTSRATEFASQGSSGFARFVAPFILISRDVFANFWTALLGNGPGSITGAAHEQIYETFDPTWAKLIYEYGLLGTMAYSYFFYAAFVRGKSGLRFPLAFTYLLLGGYLLDTSIIAWIVTLVVWPGQPVVDPESERAFREFGR